MELWFILAIMSAFSWGFASVLLKASIPKLGVTRTVSLLPIIEGIMYFAGFWFWRNSVSVGLGYAALALVSALLGTVAYLCFFEAVVAGQVAIVGTISAAYPSLTVIGAVALLSESLTAAQLVGVAAIISGIVALSYDRNPHSERSIPPRSLSFALLAFALWGLWSLTAKIAVSEIGAGNVFGFYVISSVAGPLVYLWFRRTRLDPLRLEGSWASWVFGIVGIALNVSGTLIFTFALSIGLASLVVPISSAYPVVTVTAALLLLGEKLNRLQLAALGCVITGLLIIAIIG
jgi:drug/metabolite transporter (DMT)-like permease